MSSSLVGEVIGLHHNELATHSMLLQSSHTPPMSLVQVTVSMSPHKATLSILVLLHCNYARFMYKWCLLFLQGADSGTELGETGVIELVGVGPVADNEHWEEGKI